MSEVWSVYAINGNEVVAPDEESWTPISLGTSLTGEQKRSPYRVLEWRKTVAGQCRLDWLAYDNTILTSLTCRPPNALDRMATYTDVICQAVNGVHRRSKMNEVVATFLVNLNSAAP